MVFRSKFCILRWTALTQSRLVPLATVLIALFSVSPLHADLDGDEFIRAQNHYLFQEYQEALVLLERLATDDHIPDALLFDAHILQGQCQVRMDHPSLAHESFCKAHRIDPKWRPDLEVLEPDELEEFAVAIGDCSTGKPWYMKPVSWVAGGAAVVLGVVLAGGGGGDPPPDPPEETLLPEFPAPPSEGRNP